MSEKRRGMEKRLETVPLDGAGIDRLSELLVEALVGAEADRKDILRLRLALEDALALWQPRLPVGTACTFRSGVRLGRQFAASPAPGWTRRSWTGTGAACTPASPPRRAWP